MTARPWVLAESVWPTVREARYDVVALPWGATEAHNRHLPYSTDNIEASEVAIAAAALAWERGARVVVLPGVPFGVNTGQRSIPYCLNLNPSTQLAVLGDLVRAVEPHGARKLVVVNGHGATISSRFSASCNRAPRSFSRLSTGGRCSMLGNTSMNRAIMRVNWRRAR